MPLPDRKVKLAAVRTTTRGGGCVCISHLQEVMWEKKLLYQRENASLEIPEKSTFFAALLPGLHLWGKGSFLHGTLSSGPRELSSGFCRQSRVLRGCLLLIVCLHSPSARHPALIRDTSAPLRVKDAKIFWAPRVGGLYASRSYDLANWFPLIKHCCIIQKMYLTVRGKVRNDVIIMEPLISTVTVLFQVENGNNT